MSAAEKFCLKWNDFQTNASSSFQVLRNDQEFSDVTLVCGDKESIEAHKVILASASEVFYNILLGNKHLHPLIYMRGTNLNILSSLVDFIYYGEANILHENLEEFLALAEELGLKGLTENKEQLKSYDSNQPLNQLDSNHKNKISQSPILSNLTQKDDSFENKIDDKNAIILSQTPLSLSESFEPTLMQAKTTVSFNENGELDEKVNSLLTQVDGTWTCRVCGKTALSNSNGKKNLRKHIEIHIEGISLPCGHCGKILRSRNTLQNHFHTHHKNVDTV